MIHEKKQKVPDVITLTIRNNSLSFKLKAFGWRLEGEKALYLKDDGHNGEHFYLQLRLCAPAPSQFRSA